MTISEKRIDNLCRWHTNKGGWYLQLDYIRTCLLSVVLSPTSDTEWIYRQLDKINKALMPSGESG